MCRVVVAYHDKQLSDLRQRDRTGDEQQGQSVLDICGGFICPLCASWCTLNYFG